MSRIYLVGLICVSLIVLCFCVTRSTKGKNVEIEYPDTYRLAQGQGTITYKIKNSNLEDVQIIGFGAGCGENCCLSPAELHFPIIIRAKSEFYVTLPYVINTVGKYELKTVIYYDDGKATKGLPLVLTGCSISESTEQQ